MNQKLNLASQNLGHGNQVRMLSHIDSRDVAMEAGNVLGVRNSSPAEWDGSANERTLT